MMKRKHIPKFSFLVGCAIALVFLMLGVNFLLTLVVCAAVGYALPFVIPVKEDKR